MATVPSDSLFDDLLRSAEFNLARLREIAKQAADGGDDVERLRQRAFAHYYARNDELAAELLNTLCALAPSADAFATLAQAHFRAGRLDAAADAAQRAVSLDVKAAMGYQILASVALAQGRAGDARASAERAAALDPSDVRNTTLVALAQRALGEDGGHDALTSWRALIGLPKGEGWTGQRIGLQQLATLEPTV